MIMLSKFFLIFLFLSFYGFSINAWNATSHSSAGRICTLDSENKTPICKRSEIFNEFVEKLLTEMKLSVRPAPGGIRPKPKVGGGDVCSSVSSYVPSYCTCTDNSGGGVVYCPYNVVIDGSTIDTISVSVTMEVCANPATIGISMTDGDTGLTFSTSLTSGETGSIPTGILIGVPGVGDVEIILMYKISGNIDSLTVDLGVDLEATVLGFSETCSAIYPSKCPVWFFEETIDFGSYC